MFCPQCGQQQTSDMVRFCSRCGFPLDGVIQLLHNRGLLPAYQPQAVGEMSPKRKGVRQGVVLLLAGLLLVPILGILSSFSGAVFFEILCAVAAIICFLGGPVRMLFAALFEDGAPARMPMPMASYAPPPAVRSGMLAPGALPPASVNAIPSWRPRPNTAELMQPPSVTENTTRLLEKEEPKS